MAKYPKGAMSTIFIACSWFPAWDIAGEALASALGSQFVAALDLWVEKGIAPDHFIGTGKSIFPDSGKPLTRPICAYPGVAGYKGTGDINDASNFTCVRY